MGMRQSWMVGVALAGMLVFASPAQADFSGGSFKGKQPPDLNIETWINGQAQTLADLRGKVVLLEYWATW